MKAQKNVLTLVLPPELAMELGELFDIQLELQQSKKERLGDNIYRFIIQVPPEKGSKIKNYILGSISDSKRLNLN